MCGICGYIAKRRIDDMVLSRMNDTMIHRGPDDAGVWSAQIGNVGIGLAQRRLSIMDLSSLGHQPMLSKNEKQVIVFNGEIYNYNELKKELQGYGHTFHSDCDTEVILEGYLEWGDEVLTRLNGMFAIVLFDIARMRVLMARDRIGKKPFYYYWDGQQFIFGSELKPIMMYPGFERRIRTDAIARYLCTNYINEPDTIFENTYKLEAGGFLIWESGKVEKGLYWDLLEEYRRGVREQKRDYTEIKQELTGLLQDATARRMIADVPCGTLLSGGIDSSLVTALACQNSRDRVKSYSIGFEEEEYNEAEYAKEVADYLGTEHTELYITENEVARMFDRISFYFDEPFADSSQLCTMLVSELAKRDITVALSGDGGDELFCGYEIYDALGKRQRTDWLADMIYVGCKLPGIKSLDLLGRMPEHIRGVVDNYEKDTKIQFYLTKLERKAQSLLKNQGMPVKNHIESLLPHDDWRLAGMLLDMKGYLPNEILTKVDRCSMKYALESRSPILDYRVIEYSFQIPQNFKFHKGEKKFILKDITYDLIPKELLNRPKKGFSVPVAKWMRTGTLRQKLEYFSSEEYLNKQDIFQVNETGNFIRSFLSGSENRYQGVVWAFYVFQEWYDYYIAEGWHA